MTSWWTAWAATAPTATPTASGGGEAGLPIVLGAVLDGIPESMVLGLGLLSGQGVSVAFLAAVFISNFPEGLAGTSGLLQSGWTRSKVLGLWIVVVVVSALASLAGYGVFDSASPSAVAFVLSFAGGAVLTMLADSMMPDAFADGGKAGRPLHGDGLLARLLPPHHPVAARPDPTHAVGAGSVRRT